MKKIKGKKYRVKGRRIKRKRGKKKISLMGRVNRVESMQRVNYGNGAIIHRNEVREIRDIEKGD